MTAGVIPIDRDGTPLSTFLCVVVSVRFILCVRACVCVTKPVAQDKSVISATNDTQLADYFLGLLRDSTYAIR